MLKKHLGMWSIAALISFPLSSTAEMSAANLSAGIKLGMVNVNSDAAKDFENITGANVELDNGTAFGLHSDYHVKDNWYADVEFISSSFDADIKMDGSTITTGIDVTTLAAYGAYRSSGKFYYLAKLGLIYEYVSGRNMSEREIGVSFGLGAGVNFQNNFSLEADFTCIDKDIGFIGLTAKYKLPQ